MAHRLGISVRFDGQWRICRIALVTRRNRNNLIFSDWNLFFIQLKICDSAIRGLSTHLTRIEEMEFIFSVFSDDFNLLSLSVYFLTYIVLKSIKKIIDWLNNYVPFSDFDLIILFSRKGWIQFGVEVAIHKSKLALVSWEIIKEMYGNEGSPSVACCLY